MPTLKISSQELIHWMNAIRNLNERDRTRFLDSVWQGQIDSKVWLVNTLAEICVLPSNIYIFGGWTGILSNMILQDSRNLALKIRSIDIDPWCEQVADTVNKIHEMNGWRFKAVTADMATYEYQTDLKPHVVINTSTEHVDQIIYDTWLSKIPLGTLVVIQGNNFFDCDEHVRCSHSLQEFEQINQVKNPIYSGTLNTGLYDRYLSIWRR